MQSSEASSQLEAGMIHSRIQPQPVTVQSPLWLRTLRRNPYVYSVICKSRLEYSRHVLAARQRGVFRQNKELFAMSPFENQHCAELRKQGYTVLDDFIPTPLIDSIFTQADQMFREARINMTEAYSVQNKFRKSLEGLSYDELAASEKFIAVKDPLINIRECIRIAFHETLLRIAANFLHFVPTHYFPMMVRDFPHARALESSNFHKDNDQADSVQIFVYLVDIDDTRGPLVYIPRTNQYDAKSCRPRVNRDLKVNANDGRLSDAEVEKHYPREEWKYLRVRRGSVAFIHGNGIHKGPAWPHMGSSENLPRTAIRIDVHGPKAKINNANKTNVFLPEDLLHLSPLQQLFANEWHGERREAA